MDDLVSGLLFLPDALTSESFQLQERWWNVTKSFRERQWEEGQRFYRQFGDMEIWPFLHQADYAAALKNPTFLLGHSRRTSAICQYATFSGLIRPVFANQTGHTPKIAEIARHDNSARLQSDGGYSQVIFADIEFHSKKAVKSQNCCFIKVCNRQIAQIQERLCELLVRKRGGLRGSSRLYIFETALYLFINSNHRCQDVGRVVL